MKLHRLDFVNGRKCDYSNKTGLGYFLPDKNNRQKTCKSFLHCMIVLF